MHNKTDCAPGVSAINTETCQRPAPTASYRLCRVAAKQSSVFSPPPPPTCLHHQCARYLFTQYLLLLHSSRGWIMAIFPPVKPYCKAHILKISICSGEWERERERRQPTLKQCVHTAPLRSYAATAEHWMWTSDKTPERLMGDGQTDG